MKVLLEPDGPHLRYSAETAKHQPRRCHNRCLMPPAIAMNTQTRVHKCTERQQRRKWRWVTVMEQMGFKFALSATVRLNKCYYDKYLHAPDNLLHALTLEESARWSCSCLILVCVSAYWISTSMDECAREGLVCAHRFKVRSQELMHINTQVLVCVCVCACVGERCVSRLSGQVNHFSDPFLSSPGPRA